MNFLLFNHFKNKIIYGLDPRKISCYKTKGKYGK